MFIPLSTTFKLLNTQVFMAGKVPNVQWHYGAIFSWVLKAIHLFISFLQKSDQNQSWLAHTRFPALSVSYMYLLPVLIGSLDCPRPLWLVSDYFSFSFTKFDSNHITHTVFCKTGSIIYTKIRCQSSPSIQWLQPGLALTDGRGSSAFFGAFLTRVGLSGASASHFLLTI